MDKDLEQRWARVVARRERMLAELAAWPETTLRARPPRGGWSALEVVDHLVRTHREVLHRMTSDDGGGRGRPVRLGDRVRGWMVVGVMWLPTRVAMPKAVVASVTPTQTAELPGLGEEWKQVDASLHDFIANLTPERQRSGLARHPVSGWLNARAGIRFLESHLVHHGYQIARIRKAVRKI